MTPLTLTNRHALALAGLLAISIPVGAQPGKTKAAEPPANRDPFFTPTAAKSTSTMPRVIIRTIREDRAGNIWFATFCGPIRYDGISFRAPKTSISPIEVNQAMPYWPRKRKVMRTSARSQSP